MDLHQRKLTKDEWNSIEIPVSAQEKRIIGLITQGYHNVHIRQNKTNSLLSFLKIDYSEALENFVFMKYIQPKMNKMSQKYGFTFDNVETKNCTLKKADKIRFANTDKQLWQGQENEELFEFVLLDLLENLYKYKSKKSDKWLKFYYTLTMIGKYNVNGKNKVLIDIIDNLLKMMSKELNIEKLVAMGQTLIERND